MTSKKDSSNQSQVCAVDGCTKSGDVQEMSERITMTWTPSLDAVRAALALYLYNDIDGKRWHWADIAVKQMRRALLAGWRVDHPQTPTRRRTR